MRKAALIVAVIGSIGCVRNWGAIHPPDGASDAPTSETAVLDGSDAPSEANADARDGADVSNDGVDTGDVSSDVPPDLVGCDATVCGSRCVDTATDPTACGGCGNVCPVPTNGAAHCAAGVCSITCATGYHACGSVCADDSSPSTCGSACTTCPSYPQAMATCVANGSQHQCGIQCRAGFADCDGVPTNGCETDLSFSNSCGGCNNVCPVSAPVCAPSGAGYACATSCSGTASTLCGTTCVDLTSDPNHCGTCTMTCPVPSGGTATCTGGTCGNTCPMGTHACGGTCASDTSIQQCGTSCTMCPSPPNTVPACVSGMCQHPCAAGFADCDADPTNGCETNLSLASSCGACHNTCSAATPVCARNPDGSFSCSSGCLGASVLCGTTCVDTATDAANCGACGQACAPGQTCVASVCTGRSPGLTCTTSSDCPGGGGSCLPSNFGWKSGYCAYPCASDTDCGAGGAGHCIQDPLSGNHVCLESCPPTGCRSGYTCVNFIAVCVPSCAGQEAIVCGANLCDEPSGLCHGGCTVSSECSTGSTCVNGRCECATATNCGTGQVCNGTTQQCGCASDAACGAGLVCDAQWGECTPGTACPAGQNHCAGNCVDLTSSTLNCGACAHSCYPGQTCVAGLCNGVAPGAACSQNQDCPGTAECLSQQAGFPGGFCAYPCASDTGCPTGDHCDPNAHVCLLSCGTNADCRSGYVCGPSGCVPDCRIDPALVCGEGSCGANGVCTPTCASNSACASNVCNNSQCACTLSTLCGLGRFCNTGVGHCACADDSICTPGNRCDFGFGYCITGPSCVAGTHSCNGTCTSDYDPNSCGPSNCVPCPAPPANATETCTNGSCGFSCNSGYHPCGGNTCASDSDATQCGSACMQCPTPVNGVGTAACIAGTCAFSCPVGYVPLGSGCAPAPPRQIAPISNGILSVATPQFRWAAPATALMSIDAQLCTDRACVAIVGTTTLSGSTTSTIATSTLSPGVYYWHIRGNDPAGNTGPWSPTWEFRVPHPTGLAGSPPNTSWLSIFDDNGDGYEDLAVLDATLGQVYIYRGVSGGPLTNTPSLAIATPGAGMISNAGDVNGDGFSDLVVGGPVGNASVFLGGSSGLSATPFQRFTGPSADAFGQSVAGLGDIDGDGYSDVVIGAPSGSTGSGSGYVQLWFGGSSAFASQYTLQGPAGGNFGTSVASAGDVNGDGYSDLIVGANNAPAGAGNTDGAAYVYTGRASASTMAPSLNATLFNNAGYAEPSGFAAAVRGVGDLNGDGYTEVSMSQYGDDSTNISYGSATGSVTMLTDMGYSSGEGIPGSGDFNGDGFGDLILGDYGFSGGNGTAQLYVGSGSGVATTATATFQNNSMGQFFATLIIGGDFDGDGFCDFADTNWNPFATGAVSVYRGSAAPFGLAPVQTFIPGSAQFGQSLAWLSTPRTGRAVCALRPPTGERARTVGRR